MSAIVAAPGRRVNPAAAQAPAGRRPALTLRCDIARPLSLAMSHRRDRSPALRFLCAVGPACGGAARGVRWLRGRLVLEGACMSGGVANLVLSGPLILAVPVAVAAGAVTFLSPCVLPLVPGYLSYVTGMSGTAAGLDRAPARQPAAPAMAAAQAAGPVV